MTLQDKMNKLFATGFTIATDGRKTTFTKTIDGAVQYAVDSMLSLVESKASNLNEFDWLIDLIKAWCDISNPLSGDFSGSFGMLRIEMCGPGRVKINYIQQMSISHLQKLTARLDELDDRNYSVSYERHKNNGNTKAIFVTKRTA